MFLGELEKPVSTKMISKVLRETFDFELSKEELTESKAKFILEDVLAQISDFRSTDQYFLGERNAVYLSMLATAKYLTEYLREKNTLLEKNPPRQQKAAPPAAKAAMYHGGIQKGLGHGVDTARKFVPHVAGSAIGAFAAGLKGQALASEHGQVKITDLEKELESVDFRNPASIKTYADNQTRKHFAQYTPEQQKVISQYQQKLISGARNGVKYTPDLIKTQIASLPGNPFKNLTDPDKLVANLMGQYEAAKIVSNKSKQVPARMANTQGTKMTELMNDVVKGLVQNQYQAKDAANAVKQAAAQNPAISNNFQKLFMAAQDIIRK